MDENTQAKFAEKVKELLNMAKKKKNVLEYQEISDFFADMPLEEEQMEKVLEYLDQNNVDVLRITDDDDVDDEEIILTDEDEVDVENIDLSVPEGVSIEDPVRMYLKEIGKVRRKRSSWHSGWKRVTRRQKSAWQRLTYVWWSALPKDMWAVECCSWI